jgi:hypothetical protein
VSACASANEGQCIVTDERRRNRPKGARPSGVVAGSLSDSVTLTGPDNQSALRKVPCRKASCDNHGVQMWSNKGLSAAGLPLCGSTNSIGEDINIALNNGAQSEFAGIVEPCCYAVKGTKQRAHR